VCKRLTAAVSIAERKHAEALGILMFHAVRAESPEVREMRIAESEARLEAELARLLLAVHERHHAEAK
jgi:hypothetical protein